MQRLAFDVLQVRIEAKAEQPRVELMTDLGQRLKRGREGMGIAKRDFSLLEGAVLESIEMIDCRSYLFHDLHDIESLDDIRERKPSIVKTLDDSANLRGRRIFKRGHECNRDRTLIAIRLDGDRMSAGLVGTDIQPKAAHACTCT